MRGYYEIVAFPPRNQPDLPFHAADGLTGGLPDVRAETLRLREPDSPIAASQSIWCPRRCWSAIKAPSLPYQSGTSDDVNEICRRSQGIDPDGAPETPDQPSRPSPPGLPPGDRSRPMEWRHGG